MAATAASTVKDDAGSLIPSSQRPDGTWRKPRRVREGYVPQEEVPLYESKGKVWSKSKPSHVVGMAPSSQQIYVAGAPSTRNTIPGLTIAPGDQASKLKKKKKKKKTPGDTQGISSKLQEVQLEPSMQIDPSKKLKNLKKRLREVEQLEQKIASGEVTNPDKDQLEKVKRKEDLKEQIEILEDVLLGPN